jgi:hypothetical protein
VEARSCTGSQKKINPVGIPEGTPTGSFSRRLKSAQYGLEIPTGFGGLMVGVLGSGGSVTGLGTGGVALAPSFPETFGLTGSLTGSFGFGMSIGGFVGGTITAPGVAQPGTAIAAEPQVLQEDDFFAAIRALSRSRRLSCEHLLGVPQLLQGAAIGAATGAAEAHPQPHFGFGAKRALILSSRLTRGALPQELHDAVTGAELSQHPPARTTIGEVIPHSTGVTSPPEATTDDINSNAVFTTEPPWQTKSSGSAAG